MGNIDAAFFQTCIKIIHVGRSLVDQCFHSEMTLVCLIAADGVQFPFTDQQMCDALRQMGIFADFIRLSGNADYGHEGLIVVNRQVDAHACAVKIVIGLDFNRFACKGCLMADFMKGADSFRVRTGKDNTVLVDKIYIPPADVLHGIDDLGGKGSVNFKHSVPPIYNSTSIPYPFRVLPLIITIFLL